ncbi:AMIN domain-containing protein [Nodosilinea sp. LEGE 07088]|uniref:AMIN domain-containing protein n=1 Tax=Nodosilinea sp. LEGE 07088 TaxID=2777968 RepID=UPI00187E8705|nr:AMIN domain-containing protein [Nodosilinea sp. LEGE 07088]MBE9139634.1 AMIN domain-containing protein [Nodosilinea sp. LEGE 07088]
MDYPTHRTSMADHRTIGYRLGGWAGAGLMASTMLVLCPVAQAETLAAWQFDPATQQLTLTLPSGVTPAYTVETSPARIVLTIPQTQLGSVATQQSYSGAVTQISLTQVSADTVIVLDLAADAVLAPEGASLVAITPGNEAGASTRWVLTALAAPTSTSALTATPQMVVDLPIIPGNDPRLGFPAAGTGRLSTSAANLMLPSDIDNLANLPETLPVDPFNLGQPGEQVSVPSLAELDAVVGPVATAPQPSSPLAESPEDSAAQPEDIATLPPVSPPAGTTAVLTLEPPPLSPNATTAPPVATAPSADVETPEPADVAPIDSETSGVPIAVMPPEPQVTELAAPAAPEIETAAPAAPEIETPAIEAPTVAVEPPVAAAPLASDGSAAIAAEPPPSPTPQVSQPDAVIATDPPELPNLDTESTTASSTDASAAINQEPPPATTLPVELAGTDPNLLAVPNAPTTTSQGNVIPPETPVVLASAGEPILFGSPLPNSSQAAFPDAVNPPPADRPLAPDTLVAAGTVLELRYVGDEPLNLNTNSSQNQVLLLAQDIRDPITNGIVAPAGSQLIGQFESTPNGQQWVSKMLIAPTGQQVSFSTTSDYLVGTPDVSPPRLAAGAGLGALALMVLTGFTGIGLVGGALIGATTAVGTSPQYIVIEPNQVLQVQVMEDIPRAIPIASAPENSREWGAGGW